MEERVSFSFNTFDAHILFLPQVLVGHGHVSVLEFLLMLLGSQSADF